MGGFFPVAGTAAALHITLGYVNASGNLTNGSGGAGNVLEIDVSQGYQFTAADVGNVIMVMQYPAAAPLWTTIASYVGSNKVTLTDSAGPVLGKQTVIYREISAALSPGGAYILSGSAGFRSSLTTRAEFDFSVHSPDGSFVAINGYCAPGQPVLVFTGSGYGNSGDVFGGAIEQAKATNYPGNPAIFVDCQCVSWDKLLSDRLILLAAGTTSTTTDSFHGDGHTEKFNLTEVPLSIVSMLVNAYTPTWGPVGGAVAQWYWDPTSTEITQDPTQGNTGSPVPLDGTKILYVEYTYVAALQYTNQTTGAIASALGALLGPEGVTVTATVTGPTIVQIQFTDRDTIDSALSTLCDYVSSGGANYWYYMDARRGLHFDQQGVTVAAPWNIDSTDGSNENVLVQVSNTLTIEKLVNAVVAKTSTAIGADTDQQFLGNGVLTQFNLTYPPAVVTAMNVIDYTGSTPVVSPISFGIRSDPTVLSTRNAYWAPGSTLVNLDPAINPAFFLPVGFSLDVVYSPTISAIQQFVNSDPTTGTPARQKIEGGTGEHDTYYEPSGSGPVLSGANIAQVIAEYYSALSEGPQVVTYRQGLASGQSITINLPGIAVGSYVVDSVRMTSKGNVLLWAVGCLAGAAIGDWRTAFINLTSGGGSSFNGAVGSGGGGGGGGTANTTTQYVTAPATAVAPAATAADGALLVVIVTQGSTPGAVTWSAAFAGVTATTIPVAANTRSTLLFVGSTLAALWYLLPATLGRKM